ncbi:MAG: T9SS type A sorting domain-containing protein [Leeuwenhoekiella sp.]
MKAQTLLIVWLGCLSLLGRAQDIASAEYFFNTDPGFGNGQNLSVASNSGGLTQTFSIPTTGLPDGFNTLVLRAKDDTETWSMYQSAVFYISNEISSGSTATAISEAEYFFNTDPGFGNGEALSVQSNTGALNQQFAIPVSGLPDGFNTLVLRAKDDNGTWSMYQTAVFYISNEITSGSTATVVSEAEYFFNEDPGFGNGKSLSVPSNTGSFSTAFALPVDEVSSGFNVFVLRVKDDAGTWSLYDKRVFYINTFAQDQLSISPVVKAEYFYDTDPGVGKATPIDLTLTDNPQEVILNLATENISCDIHDFYIRIQNEEGVWSFVDYRKEVEVYDNAPPTIVHKAVSVFLDENGQASVAVEDVDDGSFDDCQLVSLTLAQTNFTCNDLGENEVTITALDAEDKKSEAKAVITVLDEIQPVAKAKNITVQLDSDGEVVVDASSLDDGSTDNCSVAAFALDKNTFGCAETGENMVVLTVTDASGNTATTEAVITVIENVAPIAMANDITLSLDKNGQATLLATDVDQSTDNCGIVSQALDKEMFTCDNLGENQVKLSVADGSDNTASTDFTVTVVDDIVPNAVAKNMTVSLNEAGSAVVSAEDLDDGSTDNCSITGFALDKDTFGCAEIGENTVILTVTDGSGNTATAEAIITVVEDVPPVAMADDTMLSLDENGQATLVATDVDQSTDNCGIVSQALDKEMFTCDNLGENQVELSVADGSGNAASIDFTVTVVDDIVPNAVAKNLTVSLNEAGSAVVSAEDLDDGSTDNCLISGFALDKNTFGCAEIGENTVILTVTDSSGNSATAEAIITVIENVAPIAIAGDLTITLDETGTAKLAASDVDAGSTDNCGIDTMELDQDSFGCSQLGENVVNLTVQDMSGNTAMATATITVIDERAPAILGKDMTYALPESGTLTIDPTDLDNGTVDNCGFTLSVDRDTFDQVGEYPVTLTATDGSGNMTSVEVTVTVTETLGVDDLSQEIGVRIFPNPVRDMLTLQSDQPMLRLKLFDISGKKILEENFDQTDVEFDVSRVQQGVYLLQIHLADEMVVTKRLIKE